jgi:D-3-phosphoglycerate dehydrogenase / 2-oxoglutarate reductase
MPRILVMPDFYRNAQGAWRDVLESAGLEVVFPPVDCTQVDTATFLQHLRGIDGTLASMERYNPTVFANSKLKAVARIGVGYDAVDIPAATQHGVVVTITPGTNEHSVAEQAVALITALFRDTARRDREIRHGKWRRDCPRRLAGNTIGLVGLGRIGRAMVPRCQGLGLKVFAYDPVPNPAITSEHSIEWCSFDELLQRSDIVSLHLPCTPETVDLINATTLARMKRGAVLINTSRGGLVDELALAAALANGHLFGAGLDVCKVEPLPANSPLRSLENIVFSPHLGGIDQTALDAMSRLAAECLADLFHGRWPEPCVVNPETKIAWSKWIQSH